MNFTEKRFFGPVPKYPLVKNYVPDNKDFIIIAGPCSVENEDQIKYLAEHVAKLGATHLRGGIFRAGTYPSDNFGLVDESLIKAYYEAACNNGLKNIIEVLDYSPTTLALINDYSHCLQVGARSMQNYSLLKKVAGYGKQTFLKRHPGTTIDEWLGACEYLLATCQFCDPVLIERGSVTHMRHVRWDLSISSIPAVKKITQVPIIVDASHGTGRRDLVEPMTLAGVASGADGVLLEVHQDPEKSISDADQAITLDSFKNIMDKVNKIRMVI